MVGEEADMSGREITANMVRKVVKKGEMVPQVGDILDLYTVVIKDAETPPIFIKRASFSTWSSKRCRASPMPRGSSSLGSPGTLSRLKASKSG